MLVPDDPGDITGVRNDIANVDGDEGPGDLQSTKAPLLVHGLEALLEGKDEGVGKPRQQRAGQDNRFAHEHLVRADHGNGKLVEGDSGVLDLIGTVDVGVLPRLAASLGLLVHDYGGAALGHEEVEGLGSGSEDELDPEVPVPREELLDGTTDHGADGCTTHRGHDNKSDGPLLIVWSVQVSDHAQGHASTSGAETTLLIVSMDAPVEYG